MSTSTTLSKTAAPAEAIGFRTVVGKKGQPERVALSVNTRAGEVGKLINGAHNKKVAAAQAKNALHNVDNLMGNVEKGASSTTAAIAAVKKTAAVMTGAIDLMAATRTARLQAKLDAAAKAANIQEVPVGQSSAGQELAVVAHRG